MKFVSMKRDTVKQLSSRLIASVLFLLMTTTIATAMADNIHIYEISEGSDSVEVRTFSTEPADILADAGYDPNDYEILSEALRGNQLIGLRIGKSSQSLFMMTGRSIFAKPLQKQSVSFFYSMELQSVHLISFLPLSRIWLPRGPKFGLPASIMPQ